MRRSETKIIRAKPPWWLTSHAVVIVSLLPLLMAAWLVPEQFHWGLRRPHKFMDSGYFLLGLCGMLSIVAGSWLASRLRPHSNVHVLERLWDEKAFAQLLFVTSMVALIITVAAYFIWFHKVLSHPNMLVAILMGERKRYDFRVMVGTIPGITTLTQAGIFYTTLFAMRVWLVPKARPGRLETLAFFAILMLALVRNLIWSERLALIELLIPLVVIAFRSSGGSRLAGLAPILAVIGLILFFALFEYFRSWSAFYKYREHSFWLFALYRLSGYYITAIDNAVGYLDIYGSLYAPLHTVEWFWHFPLHVGQVDILNYYGRSIENYFTFLNHYAWREFNNAAGLYLAFVDFGYAGGLLFWFIFGLMTGIIYRGFVRGTLAGILLYPSWYVGLLELPRVPYLFQQRYFPAFLLFVIFMLSVHLLNAIIGRSARRSSMTNYNCEAAPPARTREPSQF